jgi:hypothetical protein
MSVTCKGCQLTALRWQMSGKKWRLLEPDGKVHYCKAYRKPAKLEIRVGPRVVGAQYRESCGRCDALPWEDCECSFNRLLDIAETA